MQLLQKKHRNKYLKGSKGVISILLCLVISPILTVASALIEFSRYQSTTELAQEIVECSELSTLANYDQYLQDRFGLFAITQTNGDENGGGGFRFGSSEAVMIDDYEKRLKNNLTLLGQAVEIDGDITIDTSSPLSDTWVLKQQIMDFSENTVLTETLMNDLKLEELINRLTKLKKIKGVSGQSKQISKVAKKIKTLVNKGDKLKDALQAAREKEEEYINTQGELVSAITALYQKIHDDGTNFSDAALENGLAEVAQKYSTEMQTIYNKTRLLYTQMQEFISALNEIPAKAHDFYSALEDAWDAYDDAMEALEEEKQNTSGNSNSPGGANGSGNTNTNTSTGEAMFSSIEANVEEAFGNILEDLQDTWEDGLDDLVDTALDTAVDLTSQRMNAIKKQLNKVTAASDISEDYFSVPLSENAKADMKELLKIYIDYTSVSSWSESSMTELTVQINSRYTIDYEEILHLENIKNAFQVALNEAQNSLVEKCKSSTLSTLLKVIRQLFDLDVFYDGDLNAYLSDEVSSTLFGSEYNPYATLLSGIEKLLQSIDDFTTGVQDKKFSKIIDAVIEMFDAIDLVCTSVFQYIENVVNKIGEVVGYLKGDNNVLECFYELLMLSSYITHDLPNRTNNGEGKFKTETSQDEEGNTIYTQTFSPELTGQALTGYSYKNIVVPAATVTSGLDIVFKGVSGLKNFLGGAIEGGSDTTFKGAELEYIVAGTKSEIMNQVITFMNIYFMRMIFDIPAIFSDTEVSAMAAGASIASWAVYLLVMLGEPFCDTIILVNGGETPLLKEKCYLSPSGSTTLINDVINIAVSNEGVRGELEKSLKNLNKDNKANPQEKKDDNSFKMSYSTHVLLCLMLTTGEDDMLVRLMDIIQLESNSYYTKNTNHSFDIKKTYTCIETVVPLKFNSFISVFQFNGNPFFHHDINMSMSY